MGARVVGGGDKVGWGREGDGGRRSIFGGLGGGEAQ